MLTGVHILLTYQCTFECDHCFLHSSPSSDGTMTLETIQEIFEESLKIGSVRSIFFEGGEPFLYYPLLLEGVKRAHDMGFQVGIVTNSYWAVSEKDAELWLKPLQEAGLDHLTVSDDKFHHGEEEINAAKRARAAANKLGIKTSSISIKKPASSDESAPGQDEETAAGIPAMFKGRAVEKLTAGLPRRTWDEFNECPHEDLKAPSRVHIDPYGHVHACQGISMGNIFQTPLSSLIKDYDVESNPICAPLAKGGPVALAKEHGVKHDKEFIDACHFCYLTRLELMKSFPDILAPRQVYGLKAEK